MPNMARVLCEARTRCRTQCAEGDAAEPGSTEKRYGDRSCLRTPMVTRWVRVKKAEL